MVNNNLYDDALVITYAEGDTSLERTPKEFISDLNDKSHIVVEGEKLTDIAHFFYGTSRKWYIIADANNLVDIFTINPGTELIIPNENKI